MEDKTFYKVYNAVGILIKERNQQSLNFLELENGKLSKQIDTALNQEKGQIGTRFGRILEKFENVDNVVEEHIDTIAVL